MVQQPNVDLADLTERLAAAEARAAEIEARYHFLVANSPDELWQLDKDYRFTYLSGGEITQYGYRMDQIIGMPVFALFKPEGIAHIQQVNAERLEKERLGLPTGVIRFELEECRPDGSWLWVEINVNPLRNAAGELVGYFGVTRDISARKRAEDERARALAALAESEATLRNLVLRASDGIVLLDGEGRVMEWNPALEDITGLGKGEVMGCEFAEVLAELQGEPDRLVLPGAGQPARPHDRLLVRSDGVKRTVQAAFFPIPRGQASLWAGIIRDITDLRHTEANLVERQKLESIGVLAGGMAHDFNNIFQAVLGQADLAQRKIEPNHPAARHIEKVIPSIERAAGLTRQLMAYAGLGKYFVQAEDLAEIVRATEALARAALPENALLHLDLPAELPPILADRNQVQQVLMNLVTNAGEALMGQGNVRVTIGAASLTEVAEESFVAGAVPKPGEYVYLRVADDGSGIDAKTLARVFEPFFSTHSTGRGLGLPAVLGIVRSHNGGLNLASRPGKGTVVTVLWPLAAPIQALAPELGLEAVIPAAPTKARPRTTVLVVEDEAPVLEVMADVLGMMDVPVLTAVNGQEAVAIFTERHAEIGLVILDMLMPVMNGGETLREVRKLDPTIPVVIASGYDDHEIECHLSEWHISERPNGLMQKPFRVKALREVARQFLPQEVDAQK